MRCNPSALIIQLNALCVNDYFALMQKTSMIQGKQKKYGGIKIKDQQPIFLMKQGAKQVHIGGTASVNRNSPDMGYNSSTDSLSLIRLSV